MLCFVPYFLFLDAFFLLIGIFLKDVKLVDVFISQPIIVLEICCTCITKDLFSFILFDVNQVLIVEITLDLFVCMIEKIS